MPPRVSDTITVPSWALRDWPLLELPRFAVGVTVMVSAPTASGIVASSMAGSVAKPAVAAVAGPVSAAARVAADSSAVMEAVSGLLARTVSPFQGQLKGSVFPGARVR